MAAALALPHGRTMVVQHILRIPHGDVSSVRVTCRKCGKSAELSVGEAHAAVDNNRCHFCCEEWISLDSWKAGDPLSALEQAWAALDKHNKALLVEFVVASDK